jgi:hypothetical protein
LDARVRELVITDLDPARGWALVQTLVRLATDEYDVVKVALNPLETFVSVRGDAFYKQIDELATADPAFRRALDQIVPRWPASHVRRS